MPAKGSFHRELGLTDLTFIGLGAIFGSGWLFSASHVAAIAGPAGMLSWLVGGGAVLLLGLVYCELGAALPRAGGVVRYPEYSHGVLLGSLMAFVTLIAFSSLIAIETVACRQYAAAWFPALSRDAAGDPTVLGWLVQLALLALFFGLNYFSVKTFAKANNLVSVFKFVVPLLVIVVLLLHFHPQNMHAHGFAPHGFAGVEGAVSAGGVIFAYLGLTPIVSVASEVREPQRTIPIALILSVLLSTAIYLLLQLAFLGSIPAPLLAHGWGDIGTLFSLPYHDIALALGIGWLAVLVVCDAVISPSGTGNIYMNATPRVVYAWARSGAFFPYFARIDAGSGIPRPALWLSFALSVFWTLPFPSWQAMINVVSAALVLSYAIAPITVAALRRNAPTLERPFRVRGISVLGPLSFIIATLIVYWSNWQTVSWLLGLQIALFAVYALYRLPSAEGRARLRDEAAGSWWLVVYYALLIALSWLGTFGGRGSLAQPWDSLAAALVGLVIYHWGARSGLPAHRLDLGSDND
ncbi:APC family permease [Dyella sp. A6]|uniref:APC family permease n=1 Tax=Dyella aluminiiresistens TaxID=3069105 RepID=UPI002E772474|nr:APC family permease [Dyella sp. A6]